MTSYSDLYEYCQTDAQRYAIALIIEHGNSPARAARAAGRNERALWRLVARVRAYAARKGHDPAHDATHPVPHGQMLRGQSSLYRRGEPEPVLQWVKTAADRDAQLEIVREAVQACMEELPAEPAVDPPPDASSDLVNLHVLSDLHMGCLAWSEETGGGDWDTGIAEDLLMRWWRNAVTRAPDAQTGILCQLGDMLHADNLEAITPSSGHRLDVDSRMAYVVRVVVRCLRRIMRMMLEKYPHVHVIMSDANHDPTGAMWMREWIAELYRDEPRVTVDTSPDTLNVYEHGAVSLGFHHGHKIKPEGLAKAFAERFRDVYGRTRYSYLHTGHRHHYAGKDHGIAIVTQHPTMAAKDNYAASHGYASARFATVETYSAEHGKVGELVVTPEMVRGVDAEG